MVASMITKESVVIPDNVTLECQARKIKVTGPRGTLSRDFKHAKVGRRRRMLRISSLGNREADLFRVSSAWEARPGLWPVRTRTGRR